MTQVTKRRILLIIAILIILVLVYFINYVFYSIRNLPEGEFIESVNSPDEKYIINSYLINGGVISGDAIRVEIVDTQKSKIRNIYWGYPENNTNIIWIDENTVEINGKKLEVLKDTYDWRR